jgi:hypothetical protein
MCPRTVGCAATPEMHRAHIMLWGAPSKRAALTASRTAAPCEALGSTAQCSTCEALAAVALRCRRRPVGLALKAAPDNGQLGQPLSPARAPQHGKSQNHTKFAMRHCGRRRSGAAPASVQPSGRPRTFAACGAARCRARSSNLDCYHWCPTRTSTQTREPPSPSTSCGRN